MNDILNDRRFQVGVGVVVGFGVGFAAGYFFKQSKVQQFVFDENTGEYVPSGTEPTSSEEVLHIPNFSEEDVVKAETIITEEGYTTTTEVVEFETVSELAHTKYNEAMAEAAKDDPPQELETVVIESSVFMSDDEFDYDKEVASRTDPKVPYVIHKDEFFNSEMDGFSQLTLTYYEGDDILADETETPMNKPESVVGPMRFGYGSGGDKNVFYARNEDLRAEYEIVRSTDSYQVAVLGLETETVFERRDSRNQQQKFRDE